MSFTPSVVPDISEGIPAPIGAREIAAVYKQNGAKFDFSIDEMPFLLGISREDPYQRASAEVRKQQIDTSPEPGEQTFSQWWTRSLDSAHRGAGVKFYEPASDETTKYRFARGMGIDVWTRGQVSLLKRLTVLRSATAGQECYATGSIVGGVPVVFTAINGTLRREDPALGTATTYTGSTTVVTKPVITGKKILGGTATGIVSGDTDGSTLTTLWTTANGLVKPYWAKSRIIASQANKLFDLTLAGGSIDSATPMFTHPSTTWEWTAVAETPNAILAAGRDNGTSYVYAFTLTAGSSGALPTISGAIQVAEFPPGEEVYSLAVYLGAYVALGTSSGVRIGTLSNDVSYPGTFSYGPVVVETTKPVRSLTARDRFVYAAIEGDLEGKSGAARIDLSEEVAPGRFAWSYDVQTKDTGVPTSITFLGNSDRVTLGVTGKGVYLQSPSLYEPTGYIYTGRIRYATSEPKVFAKAKIRALCPSDSQVSIFTVDPNGIEVFNFTVGNAFDTDQDIQLRSVSDLALSDLAIRLTLTANTAGTVTPVLEALTVKALPRIKVPRRVRVPLMCYDREQDRNNNVVGFEGSAFQRLTALEALESNRAIVLAKDLTTGEAFPCQVESIEFTRITPPNKESKGFGGKIAVILVTV